MGNNEFIVSSEYPGYVFVGWAAGRFDAATADGGSEKKDFFNIYVISPVSDYVSEDYHASGFKAEKKKCISADVWKDLHVGDRVRLFFDDKQRVVMVAVDN
ncbi:MAG: hypothetical protein IJ315_04155 [Firmicutes bacterium]|nr:hypothetical protein [Bacillota bacterium]